MIPQQWFPPATCLSLQHAEDLDAAFGAVAQEQAPASSDDRSLAKAASVAEAVVNTFSQPMEVYAEPELVVMDEGDASLPAKSPVIIDEWFNQFDEINSQLSQSILANCRPDGAPSGGEFVIASQINNSNGSINNSRNASNSNENSNVSNSNDSYLSNVSNDSGGNTNCYGSVVAFDGAPSGSSQIVDSEMPPASQQQKRPVSEVTSDDALDDSSPSSAIPVLVARAKKKQKT